MRSTSRLPRTARLVAWTLLGTTPLPAQQIPAELAHERREYGEWLATAAVSPFAALVQRPISGGLTIGPPGADIPLENLAQHRLTVTGGLVILEQAGSTRPLLRGRPVAVGRYHLAVTGAGPRASVIVYDTRPNHLKPTTYYPYQPRLVVAVTLRPPARPATRRVLAPDGQEVEASEAGTVAVTVGGTTVTLTVRRIPDPDGEESELEVFFRDATNGSGTYPAGRFVRLEPLGGERYRLDFNRARNPFCAYNTVFACPAPWRGNAFAGAIAAGERYHGSSQ
jgi:hypothetical protein